MSFTKLFKAIFDDSISIKEVGDVAHKAGYDGAEYAINKADEAIDIVVSGVKDLLEEEKTKPKEKISEGYGSFGKREK